MLDSRHGINLSRLPIEPPARPTVLEPIGQLAVGGDDRGCSRIFVFYSNIFPLWCNDLIRFFCMMVLLKNDDASQSRVHWQTSCISFAILEPSKVFPGEN